MPIGDLLAQITGERPKSSPAPVKKTPTAPKRKAEGELGGSVPKAVKTGSSTNGTSQASGGLALPDHRSSGSSAQVSSSGKDAGASRPSGKPPFGAPVGKSASTPTKSRTASTSTAGTGRPTAKLPVKPSSVNLPSKSTSVPKKRSYAEIMQRATLLQQKMGPIGKIQHKSITQTNSGRREREESHGESSLAAKKRGSHKVWRSETRGGNSGSTPRDLEQDKEDHRIGSSSRGSGSKSRARKEDQNNGVNGLKTKRGKQATPEPVKKVKKAALATTGYKGTARPPQTEAQNSSSSGRGRSLNGDKVGTGARSGSSYGGLLSARRARGRDYDDEMDDFIEYDDEEQQDGYGDPRQHYPDSEEDESDMEAGFSDVEDEEQQASLIARREDHQQELLEQKLKREKEERKRQFSQNRR